MALARKNGSAIDERYHLRKDGTRFFVAGKMFALYDEDGRLRGFTKIMRDISHIKVLRDTIQQAKEYAESIVDTAREPMLVLNKDFTVNTANRSFYKTFKVTKKATEGKSVYSLGDGQWNIPALKLLLEDILPYNTSFNDFEVIHDFEKIGNKIMLLNARKLWRAENKTEMILLAIEDITARKRAEDFKNAFVGVASHELRGPVGNIKLQTQLARRKASELENKFLDTILQKIENQTNKLTEQINHLMDVSRIQSGKLQLDKISFNLNSLTESVIEEMQSVTASHQIFLKGEVAREVFADKFRIGQVLTNLISNAIKYSPDANKVMIKLEIDSKNQHGIVSIKDFGLGIPEDEQKNLFKPFMRVRGTTVKRFRVSDLDCTSPPKLFVNTGDGCGLRVNQVKDRPSISACHYVIESFR